MNNLLLILILFVMIYHAIIETMRLLGSRPRLSAGKMPNYMLWELLQVQTHAENLAQMGGLSGGRR